MSGVFSARVGGGVSEVFVLAGVAQVALEVEEGVHVFFTKRKMQWPQTY